MTILRYYHEAGKHRYRVWRDDWAADQFQVMHAGDFENLSMHINFVNKLMGSTIIMLQEHFDE